MVAAGAWCAAGVVTVASPESASHRFAIPAPWWMFAAALSLALLVPAWRRRPLLAAPALLATLPWWPIPLPTVALIWTGPLAWMPMLVALLCAWGSAPLSALGRLVGARDARRSTILAASLTLAAGSAVAWNVESRVPGGDEPHYLVITQSLLNDRDIRIENNHRQRDYAAYFGGQINPDYVKRGQDGEIYSIHAPGLPALLVPAFAVSGYRGAEVMVLLLAALTGGLVWRIGWRLTDDTSAAWFGWATVAGSSTFLLHSFTIFPDLPGALVVAAGVLMLIRLERAPASVRALEVVVIAALLAGMPWLHTRFAVLAGGLGALIVVWLMRDPSRLFPARRSRVALFAIIPALSAVAWLGFFQVIYGTLNPAAPYGGAAGTRMAFVPGGLAGLFLDGQFGLAMHTPILMAIGVWGGRLAGGASVASRRLPLAVLAIAGAYLVAVATYWLWWAGTPAGPGRFTVAVLPVLVLPLADLWNGATADRRRVLLAVLAASVAITCVVAGVNHGALASNMRDAQAAWLEWLGPVVNLPRAWPSFFWTLDPSRLSTEWPFALHAFVWVAVFAGGWVVVRRVDASNPGTRRVLAGAWLMGGVMLAAQAGWWLNDVSGLDAGRSQSSVLASGTPVVDLAPLRVRARADVANALVIRTEEPGRLEGRKPWLVVDSLPAGTYTLRISTPRPRPGDVVVRVGRTAYALRTIQIQPFTQQTASLVLPVGVRGLVMTPSASLDGLAGTIDLEPTRVERGPPPAALVAEYGAARVYFFDDHVDAETEGFWVHGGQSAALAVELGGAASPAFLIVQSGRGENEIVLDVDGQTTRERFGSFETRRLQLPGSGAGPRQIRITSTSGFRPSDAGTSLDRRFLGVFVKIE